LLLLWQWLQGDMRIRGRLLLLRAAFSGHRWIAVRDANEVSMMTTFTFSKYVKCLLI